MLSNSLTLFLENGIELQLQLSSLSFSYIKDEWVTIYNPTDKARFYIHIKYLFLCESEGMEQHQHFLDSFQNADIKLDDYLHVFSSFPQPRHSSVSCIEEKPQKEVPAVSTPTVSCAVAFLAISFLIAWGLTSGISRGIRIFLVSWLSSTIFLVYPFCLLMVIFLHLHFLGD